MLCPYCQSALKKDAAECPACFLTFPRIGALVGAIPRLNPMVADTTQRLNSSEQSKLKRRITLMQRRFPELFIQLVMHEFPTEHPLSMHVFWLFNVGSIASESRRGDDNCAILIALDPVRGEAAMMPGYGLEPYMNDEAMNAIIDLAAPAWRYGEWESGFSTALDGLEKLLESFAIPYVPKKSGLNDF